MTDLIRILSFLSGKFEEFLQKIPFYIDFQSFYADDLKTVYSSNVYIGNSINTYSAIMSLCHAYIRSTDTENL